MDGKIYSQIKYLIMQVIYINIYYSLIPKKLNYMMYHMKILHNQKIKMLEINC
jgi:hypothetical protein